MIGQAQPTLALLKILALGNTQIKQGKSRPLAELVKTLRAVTANRAMMRLPDAVPSAAYSGCQNRSQ